MKMLCDRIPGFPPDQRQRILGRVAAGINSRQSLNQRRERTYPRVVKRPRHNSYHVKETRRPRHEPPRPAHHHARQPGKPPGSSMIK